ncbi:MAG: hypothetical protein R2712_24205 [Vicinamibacterales bacterium]
MAATRISVARLLELRVPIAWQEAVEVAYAAETRADLTGVPITPRNCFLTDAGAIELDEGPVGSAGALSSLQLLAAMVEGQSAPPPELQELLATADDALLGFPSEEGGTVAARGLKWFVRPGTEVEIARLATRGLAAEQKARRPAGVAAIDRLRAEVSALADARRGALTFGRWWPATAHRRRRHRHDGHGRARRRRHRDG